MDTSGPVATDLPPQGSPYWERFQAPSENVVVDPVVAPPPPINGKRYQVLHLFSGPDDRKDGLHSYLRAIKIDVVNCDIVNVNLEDQDLLDDAVWARIRARIWAGEFDFTFAGPPCRSFSESRSYGPGPPVVRDSDHLYGFPKSQARERGLGPKDFEQIRTDNLFAERAAEACSIMDSWGRGYGVEQPTPWRSAVTMFSFECFQKLIAAGAKMVYFDQCMYDGPTRKPTTILYKNVDFSGLAVQCNHPKVEQWDNKGHKYMAAHPSYVGKKDSSGAFITGSLSAYPTKLNVRLATLINETIIHGNSPS